MRGPVRESDFGQEVLSNFDAFIINTGQGDADNNYRQAQKSIK